MYFVNQELLKLVTITWKSTKMFYLKSLYNEWLLTDIENEGWKS